MKKLVAAFVALVMALGLFSLPTNQAKAAEGEDDITGIKLEAQMRHLIELEVIFGYGNNIYKPGQIITRAEFANYVSRALNLKQDGPNLFPDVSPGSVLAAGVNAVAESKIVNGGTDGLFRPADPISREQMALIISNAMEHLEMDMPEAELTFTDQDQITNDIFKTAVKRNVGLGIINGFPDDTFRPKNFATRAEAAAFISGLLKAYEAQFGEGELPPGEEEPEFYKLGTIQADGSIVYSEANYESYDAAMAAVTSVETQVVSLGEDILTMPSGIALTVPNPDNQSIFYSNKSFTSASVMFGVELYRELEYIESTEDYVKVRVADTEGYVKPSTVKLIPTAQVDKRSYYQVDAAGDLIHLEYGYEKKWYHNGYAVGPAPDFLEQGKNYYSWNGYDYFNENGEKVGTAYNYFQYLPIRTETSYTAEELDQFIDSKLQEFQALYDSNPTKYPHLKDIAEKGLLKGKGAFLKEMEEKYRINALFILGMAAHESEWGTSKYAIERNNLFGINAVDSDPDRAKYFASVEECIETLAIHVLNAKYVNPNVSFDHGAVAGNKSIGVNRRYASDPYWGLKVSRHMYGIDKALGKKDLGKYQIGMTISTQLNIRSVASTENNTPIFQYDQAGYPVVILEEVMAPDTSIWYRIISDKLEHEEGYVYSLHAVKLNTVNE
ncbi:S-layer homology domain-containing protein [Bacillus carboniphilus]|uniref:S-layer homology domain-containing protein n=1 Tax=Bacillus carboniphilus TaxID=86663 RepID=A0ABN0VRL8_9BACI